MAPAPFLPGYHLTPIAKGELGELSKLQEEWAEFEDAQAQGVRIMALVELSDFYGALEAYLERYAPELDVTDLANRPAPAPMRMPQALAALAQDRTVLHLVALERALGAEAHRQGVSLGDLAAMAAVTRRAFAHGRR